MLKKLLSYILLISIFLGFVPINTFAADDQILTAPSPSFVENQIQPVSSFKMNRYLLWYNNDKWANTFIIQKILLDRDNFWGLSFRISRVSELKADEVAEKLKLSLIQKDDFGIDQVIDTTVLEWVSSISRTEVKWLFPEGITISPNRELNLKIEVENPSIVDSTFPYYVYGEEDFSSKPLYFWNMTYFDGENEITTSDILSLSILRADNNNLWVPIPSVYNYSKLIADQSHLFNASNIKVLSWVWVNRANIDCNTSTPDDMVYRPLVATEFEYLMRHSTYFDALIDKVWPFTEWTYVTRNEYYQFSWMNQDAVKNKRMYTSIDINVSVWTPFAFCVYNETENIQWVTKKVNTDATQEIAMAWLEYNTSLFLTNKTPNQTIITLDSKKSIFNTRTKLIKWDAYDTWIDVQWGNFLKIFWRIVVNNSWFHDSNWYLDLEWLRQWHIAYKIWNSEWREWGNTIEINETGRLYLSIVDNDLNLENNIGDFKVTINKVIITNSIRDNNNLYFNLNKNIKEYSITIWETTDGTDFTEIYKSHM